MYKEDLALNNVKWLICHKTRPNQTKPNMFSTCSLMYWVILVKSISVIFHFCNVLTLFV